MSFSSALGRRRNRPWTVREVIATRVSLWSSQRSRLMNTMDGNGAAHLAICPFMGRSDESPGTYQAIHHDPPAAVSARCDESPDTRKSQTANEGSGEDDGGAQEGGQR